jgi:hypothetical protein
MKVPWCPLLALTWLAIGCGAVYPELTTPAKAPPSGRTLDPPPPRDLVYIAFASAKIPEKTRDGRQWDTGSAPDPFAKLLVDDRELLRTPIQSNTLNPTWPEQPHANYRLPDGARYRIELWDSNTLTNRPICVTPVPDLLQHVGPDAMDIECESGAHVDIRVEPAHARWGLGFSYELGTDNAVAITRVLRESPAARAGIQAGDDVVSIQGKPIHGMDEGEAQSLINANSQIGIQLELRGHDKQVRKVSVKEGVIYPAVDEGVSLE